MIRTRTCVAPKPLFSSQDSEMELNYFQIFPHILKSAWEQWQRNGPTKAFLQDFYLDLLTYGHMDFQDILVTMKLAVFFTVARYALGFLLFKVSTELFGCLTSNLGCFDHYNNEWLTRSVIIYSLMEKEHHIL